ncbi:DgyrCDS5067 [Dimorphilus gyrociliatus]|uniref:DgyrCDS5067 n=1 Tax=Dimorphilus gyrociliatus TaxID=2664684 RepID=A0A7I8VNI5_9ANNE|nr:DgyrCDS5067 [Dimorphilus gyrociliatus]
MSNEDKTDNVAEMQARVVEALPKELLFNTSIKRTRWVYIAAGFLFVSSIFYITAFTTHGWGYVKLKDGSWVEFGLWQMCDNEAHCYSPGWASIFILVQVILYGINWKRSVLSFFPDPEIVRLNFAFAFAVVSGAFTLIAGIFGIIELKASQNHFRKKHGKDDKEDFTRNVQLETIREEAEIEESDVISESYYSATRTEPHCVIDNEYTEEPHMLFVQSRRHAEQPFQAHKVYCRMEEKLPLQDLNPDFTTKTELEQHDNVFKENTNYEGPPRVSKKPYEIRDWGLMGEVKIPKFGNLSKRRNVSLLGWITLIFLLLAFALSVISFTVPGWGETTEQGVNDDLFKGRYGVWYVCSRPLDGTTGREDCEPLNLVQKVPGWWKGCQALQTIQLFMGLAGLITVIAYTCMPSFNENVYVAHGLVFCCVVATIAGIISWIVFSVMFVRSAWKCCEYPIQHQIFTYWLSYGFHCAVVTSGFFILSSITGAYETIKIRNGSYHW